MKKWSVLLLCLALSLTLLTACGKQPAQPANDAADAESAEALELPTEDVNDLEDPGMPAPAAETKDIQLLRVNSITARTEDALSLKCTPVTFHQEAGEMDTDYTLTDGDTLEYTMKLTTIIEFPQVEDLTSTVAVTGDEFDGEFRAYFAEHGEGPLFQYELNGTEITKLNYFYLP